MNITKHEHTIIIGILSAVIGIGIGGYFAQEEVVVKPPKKVVAEQPKELTPAQARKLAYSKLDDFGWTSKQFTCLNQMWGKESAWNSKAASSTKDHGIPQRHMSNNTKAEIHAFQIDPVAQIQWGLNYIDSRYGSPCRAWEFWKRNHWY